VGSIEPPLITSEDPLKHKVHARYGSKHSSRHVPATEGLLPTPSRQTSHVHQSSGCVENDENPTQRKPLDWRPQSLRSVYAFIIAMIGMITLYFVLYEISNKKQYITQASGTVNWLFRFGPQFLAVVMVEWTWRMCTDLLSILPYMALSASRSDILRKCPEAALWRLKKRKECFRNNNLDFPLWLSTLAGSLLLVPFQSTLFSRGTGSVIQDGIPFLMVTPQIVNNEFNSTWVPSIVVNALWNGVYEGNSYNGVVGAVLWDNFPSGTGLYESPAASQFFDDVVVLPFHPKDQSLRRSSYDGSATWRLQAAAVVSWMECTQVNDFNVTLTNPSADLSTWDVTVQSIDSEGCAFRKNLSQVPLSGDSNFTTTLSGTPTFALWQLLENSDDWSSAASECSPYKHVILSGPMPTQIATNSGSSYVSLDVSNWGAISCQAMYGYTQDHTIWTSQPPQQVTHDQLIPEQMIPFGMDESSFDIGMKQNFIDTRMIYNLSNPSNGQTFWGAFLANSWVPSPDASQVPVLGCSDLSTSTNLWDNQLACQMYASTAMLWNQLFVFAATVTGLALPESAWRTTTGDISMQRDNWYLDTFSFGVCVFLHLVVLVLVVLEKTLIRVPLLGFRRERYRTGLRMSPASLAGKAFLFHDHYVRRLFTGLDALKADVAASEMRKRMNTVKLELKNWRSESSRNGEPVQLAEIKIAEVKRDDKWEAVTNGNVDLPSYGPLPSDTMQRQVLRYDSPPWFLHWWLLTFIFCVIMVLIIVVFTIILPGSQTDGIGLWSLSVFASIGWLDIIAQWAQHASFSILPVLLMTSLRFWWSKLDTFFRTTQPFVGLMTEGRGKDTICLSYTQEPDIAVTTKAVSRGHWKLAYVTFVSLLVKIAIILAGGIFVLQETSLSEGNQYHLLQEWRDNNFTQADTFFDDSSMRAQALQLALNGFPQLNGWQWGFYTFPPVEVGPNSHLSLRIQGMTTKLTCGIAKASFTSTSDIGYWNAEVAEGECIGAQVHGDCSVNQNALNLDEQGYGSIGCTHWTYLSPHTCSNSSTGGVGRWWLLSVNNDDTSARTTANTSGAAFKITSSTSIICTPATYRGTTQVEVSSDSGDNIWIDSLKLQSSERVSPGEIRSDEDSSLDLQAYFAQHLNSSVLVQDALQITTSYSVDYLSFMAAANMSNTVQSLQNPSELAIAASNVYSLLFSLFAAYNTSADGSTSLLKSIDPNSPDSPTVLGVGFETRAIASRLPLLAATGIIAVYCISIPFLHPGNKRRLPVDLSYIANNISLVYDSYLIDLVRNSGEKDEEFRSLHNRMFSLGVYKGQSGEMRMGVEVVIEGADRVVTVDPEPPKGIWKIFSSRRRGSSRRNNIQEEETAMEEYPNRVSPLLSKSGHTYVRAQHTDVFMSGGIQEPRVSSPRSDYAEFPDTVQSSHEPGNLWRSHTPNVPEMTQVPRGTETSPIRRRPLPPSATWLLQRDTLSPTSIQDYFPSMPGNRWQ